MSASEAEPIQYCAACGAVRVVRSLGIAPCGTCGGVDWRLRASHPSAPLPEPGTVAERAGAVATEAKEDSRLPGSAAGMARMLSKEAFAAGDFFRLNVLVDAQRAALLERRLGMPFELVVAGLAGCARTVHVGRVKDRRKKKAAAPPAESRGQAKLGGGQG